ncbi:MAG TPA: hypothetical protein VKH40_18075, partial [Alloacidobacterium sp.]|nr:hypothetical protein [Alloacidobacterium sp.]
MGEQSPGIVPTVRAPEDRLDSWKEIATYLNRDVTTVQRWEKREGMPVHRHVHDKRGSVYALTEELDAWMQSRRSREIEQENQAEVELPPVNGSHPGAPAARRNRLWIALTAALCLCLLVGAWLVFRHRATATAEPRIR